MPTAIQRLTELQEEINRTNTPRWSVGQLRRLSFFEVDGLLHVEYYGLTHRESDWEDEEDENEEADHDESRLPIFETLALPEVSSRIASLVFDGPDEGSNGTREWNFNWLLERDVTFPELKELIIKPSPMEAHNCTVLGYKADGQLAVWLSKSPQLSRLTTPSAPNTEFFDVEHESLSSVRVGAGYDPADFILNLSCKPSPMIWHLDWSEVHNRHMDEWEKAATPIEHFEALLGSPACPGSLILRNPKLTDEQVRTLAALQRKMSRGRSFSLRVFRTSYGLDVSVDSNGFWFEREPSGRWRNSLGNEGDR